MNPSIQQIPTSTKKPSHAYLPSPKIVTSPHVNSYQPLLITLWNRCSAFRRSTDKRNDFSIDALMQRAIKKVGATDWGDKGFLTGLKMFLDGLNQGQNLHAFGRFAVQQLIIAMLEHRLKLVNLFAEHPGIHQEKITRPLFILGLPRSGTTLLYNLLAQDPTHRFMANWEAFIGQVPPKGRYSFDNDPRRNKAKWMQRFQKHLTPDIDTRHVFLPHGPEECTPILMQEFTTQAFSGTFNVPTYSAWLDDASHDSTYQHHKRTLQALQWKYPGQRWLLKSPDHLSGIEAIFKRHRQANIIHIHRDPCKSVASWASLNLLFRSTYYSLTDTHELGQQVLNRLANDMERYLAERDAEAPERFYDLFYAEFLKDPISAIRRIYTHFDFEFSKTAEHRMVAFLANHPRHQHGIHTYDPTDFGLDAGSIRDRFKHYTRCFEV